MTPSDRPALAQALAVAYEVARQPAPAKGVFDVFVRLLTPYPISAVTRAIDLHMASSEFAPTPAALLKHLEFSGPQRIAADEAWAIALASSDEAATVWLTDEILKAFDSARELLASDEVAARMAFKAAYTRITEANRMAGIEPAVIRSPGTDRTTDAAADQKAIALGFISAAEVERKYPALAAPVTQNVGLLAAPSKSDSDEARKAKEQFRVMVERMRNGPAGESHESRIARERHEATQVTKRELAERVAAYERGQQ
ncbi:hypothetical protein PCA31118_04695 [Pandoraea captiosa]|uniref:Replicative helicase inhibitor G39P N-terminal domain-containing protein n=1 Tax=Pandoraea captiosa TaxID=2508302 RepID=A0A5E5AK74_9BURK|nr:hypothetical protein [Pandoraea captiosa]VVE74171.1 hypothetical protein PCA31118_04695 [Pandoraea captiosa]